MCKISVVTSVYNCEKYIAETIESVQQQTYRDWEFILINDCSKDKSGEIINEYAEKDDRIVFIDNPKNLGQVKSLNYGISLAKGKYIARLDHDDLCREDRFEIQLTYMENHPQCVLVGSKMDYWEDGKIYPADDKDDDLCGPEITKFRLLEDSVIPHSSFFIRKSALTNNHIEYREEYKYSEDYGMIADLYNVGEIALLNDRLIVYRIFPGQLSQNSTDELKQSERKRARLQLAENIEIYDKDICIKYMSGGLKTGQDFKAFSDFLIRYAIRCGLGFGANEVTQLDCVKDLFFHGCRDQKQSLTVLMSYARSPLRRTGWLMSRSGLSFAAHCILHTNKRIGIN